MNYFNHLKVITVLVTTVACQLECPSDKGNSEIIKCIHGVPATYYSDYTFKRLSLEEIEGRWVLVIDSIKAHDNGTTFEWWIPEEGSLGRTSIYVTEATHLRMQVMEGRTMSACVKLTHQTYIDIALKDSTRRDVYNYETDNGNMKVCSINHKKIFPSNSGYYHVTVFEKIICTMAGEYVLTATGFIDEQPVAENIHMVLHVQDGTGVSLTVEKHPEAWEDSANLTCSATGDIRSVEWYFHETIVQDGFRHNIVSSGNSSALFITNLRTDDIGPYFCKVQTRCNSIKSNTVEIYIKKTNTSSTLNDCKCDKQTASSQNLLPMSDELETAGVQNVDSNAITIETANSVKQLYTPEIKDHQDVTGCTSHCLYVIIIILVFLLTIVTTFLIVMMVQNKLTPLKELTKMTRCRRMANQNMPAQV
ncbi:uncharacterized protein LOC144433874 [Glandiceps talaboti]